MMFRIVAFFTLLLFLHSCAGSEELQEAQNNALTRQGLLDWNKLLLELERHTEGYRPPVSARMYAYVQMAAYESALPAMPAQASLADCIPGAPAITCQSADFQPLMAINAAYHQLIPLFFPTAPKTLLDKAEALYQAQVKNCNSSSDTSGMTVALYHGVKVAQAFWEFSLEDTLGHDAFLYNFDKNYQPIRCPGCWQAKQPRKMPALLPYWGKVKTWVNPVDSTRVPTPPVYEETPGSKMYTEAFEIFSDLARVKKSEQWIAELWSDDVPGLTCTTVGRWFSIANQFMENNNTPFHRMLETYLLLGVGLSDAAVNTWHYKFKFNRERPEDYIRRVIHADWTPLHESPSFPAYPSGHSVFSATAATILARQFGDDILFVDNTHKGRKEFNGTPRTYHSFSGMALECAFSRITLGVHYRSDCESGLEVGRQIAAKVLALPLHRKMSEVTTKHPQH